MRVLLITVAALLTAHSGGAVLVDGIAVAVGTKVITASAIDMRIRLTAFENKRKPDLGLTARREAASRLIDQRLIEREMDVGHYPRTPGSLAGDMLTKYAASDYRSDRAALTTALRDYGLAEQDLAEDLIWQSDLLTFLDLRFRPAVEVTGEDVRKYFDEKILPKAGQTGKAAGEAAFNDLQAQIEKQLTVERSDQQLNAWLADQRQRTRIDYIEKELREITTK